MSSTSVVFAILSVQICALLAYIPHFVRIFLLRKTYDNTRPRDVELAEKSQSEWRRELAERLYGSHKNQLETIGVYAAGVATALGVGVRSTRLIIVCAVHLGVRVLYNIVYALPQYLNGVPRTIVFVASVASMIAVYTTALQHVA